MNKKELYTELTRSVNNNKCVVFDLDDTLCAPNWDIHWGQSDRFEPITSMVDLAHMLKKHGYDIVIATARPDNNLEPTLKWLEKHFPEWNALYMSNADIYSKAEDTKEQQLLAIEENWDIEFWCDDSPANCEVVQEHGIPCLRPTRNDAYWASRGYLNKVR